MSSGHGLISTLTTAALTITALLSLSIYLSTHPESPVRYLLRSKRISLPTHHNEGLLDSEREENDPLDIDDPIARNDGTPVGADDFWASMWKRKIALFIVLLCPSGINIASLVLRCLSTNTVEDYQLFTPIFILAAQVVTILIALWHIPQRSTSTSWPTTIILAVNISTQFLAIAVLSLLPSTPVPSRHSSALQVSLKPQWDVFHDPLSLLDVLLPVSYIPAVLLILLCIRRGPPLHISIAHMYPPKILDAVPAQHEALDPSQPNVSAEVQASVLGNLLFMYATPLIKKGAAMESLDFWDVPLLPANMRELGIMALINWSGAVVNFQKLKTAYGRPTNLGRMEGFNLLWKLARVNAFPLILGECIAVLGPNASPCYHDCDGCRLLPAPLHSPIVHRLPRE